MLTLNCPISGRLEAAARSRSLDAAVRTGAQLIEEKAGAVADTFVSSGHDIRRTLGSLPAASGLKPARKSVARRPRPVSIPEPDAGTIARFNDLLGKLADYHGYEVHGLEKLPKDDGFLLCSTHSVETYEMAMLMRAFRADQKREMRFLVDHLIFKTPLLNTFAANMGAVDGYRENAIALLEGKEAVGVCPGGMKEALRSSGEAYQLRWDDHRGFAEVALIAQKPVFVAVCPSADRAYYVHENPVTNWLLENTHFPLPLVSGRGLTLVPNRVKLDHYVGDAIYPPAIPPGVTPDSPEFKALAIKFHAEILQSAKRDLAAHTPAVLPTATSPFHEAKVLFESLPRPAELMGLLSSGAELIPGVAEARDALDDLPDPKRIAEHVSAEVASLVAAPGSTLRNTAGAVGRASRAALGALQVF